MPGTQRAWMGTCSTVPSDIWTSLTSLSFSSGTQRPSPRWPAWSGTKRAEDRVVTFLRLSKPIGRWLKRNVGPSTHPDPRR